MSTLEPMALFPQAAPSLEIMIKAELASGEPGLHVGVIFEEIIDLRTGAVIGHEVLTRVQSRPMGHVTPEHWFAKARKMGVSAKLEARAVDLALRVLPKGGGMISVNFSPDCLEAPEVQGALDGLADLDRPALIELSEHHHVSSERLIWSLASIRDRGLLVAVDDVGTGYSNTEFVKEVKPDVIKIDRRHVSQVDRNPAQRAFLHSYAELRGCRDALIVTEGVCSRRVADALHELSAKWDRPFLGQGYWLSKSRAAAARLAGQ